MTTVSDTIYGGSGTITITAANTFTTADGYVIPQGWTTTVTLGTGGTFSVQLPPTTTATPAGSYYLAYYDVVPQGSFTETWEVPSSATAVDLLDVRTLSPPSPTQMFSFSQLNAPADCVALGGFVKYTTAGWTCNSSSSQGLSNPMTATNDLIVGGSGGTPQRLATGTTNQFLAGGTVWRDLVLGDLPDGCTGCVLLGQGLTTPPAYVSDPEVQGLDAAGVAPTGNPVLVGGSDGTDVRTLKTDTSGDLVAVFAAAQPVTQSGNWTFSLSGAIPAGSNTIGAVNVNGTVPVSGTFWQATQPISVAALPALATGSNTIGSVNVNGTVPVSGVFWQATQPVSLASLPALAAGTSDIGKVDLLGNAGVPVDAPNGAAAPANSVQVGGVYNSTAPAPASGESEPLQLDANGYLKVNCITGCSGGSGGGNVNLVSLNSVGLSSPSAWGTAPSGDVMGVNADVLSLPPLAAGSNTIGNVGINGTVPVSGTFWQATQPVSLASLPSLPAGTNDIGKVDVNSMPAVSQPSGANLHTDVDNFPAQRIPATASTAVNDSASGLTQIIAAVSGKAIYVTSYTVVANAAVSVQWEYGTGTNCGTGTTALTGPMSFAANGGAAPRGTLFVPAGNALCLNLGSAVQVGGSVSYAQQ